MMSLGTCVFLGHQLCLGPIINHWPIQDTTDLDATLALEGNQPYQFIET